MPPEVKNLGQVAAVVFSTAAPENKKILWYDETNEELKFYNKQSTDWEPLTVESAAYGKVRVNVTDILEYLENKFNEDHFKVENLNIGGDILPKISLVATVSTGFYC
jgi:hypothetical protein